MNVIFFIEIDF